MASVFFFLFAHEMELSLFATTTEISKSYFHSILLIE